MNEFVITEDTTLEDAFRMLDSLIAKMEERELPLEESFAFYKKGLELVEFCNGKIEKVECDIRKVTEEA